MGFFDNLIKDIANGDIDKKLEQIADTVERFSGKMENTVKKAADTSEQVVKKVDTTGKVTVKSIDGIKKELA
jgi:Na+/phosphate symporter